MDKDLKNIIKSDFYRYTGSKELSKGLFIKTLIRESGFRFSLLLRAGNSAVKRNKKISKALLRILLRFDSINKVSEISMYSEIGEGLYLGHFSSITINKSVVIGKNVNIHKGVTIGQENRGKRKGTPSIGDNVWIGINSTVVGNVKIGKNVLIAPNTYVNTDVPDNSIVFGNPAQIKYNEEATKEYIHNELKFDF